MRRDIVIERPYLTTPNMDFSITCEVSEPFDRDRLEGALVRVACAHPLLRAKVVTDGNEVFFEVGETSLVSLDVAEAGSLDEFATAEPDAWDPFTQGLLRATAWSHDDRFALRLAFHHLLADGRVAMDLMLELVRSYAEDVAPAPSQDLPVQTREDLSQAPEPSWMAARTLRQANDAWAREGSRFALDGAASFAADFAQAHPVLRSCMLLDADQTEKLRVHAEKAHGNVTTAVAAGASMVFEARHVGIDIDVRDDVAGYEGVSLGSYSSTVSLDSTSGAGDLDARIWAIQRGLDAALADPRRRLELLMTYLTLDPGLVDAIAPASLGGFESAAAARMGHRLGLDKPGLGIANLGTYRDAHITQAIFMPPASPACDRCVGVVTMNGRMSLACCTYEQDVELEEGRLSALVGLLMEEDRLFPWSGNWKRLLG